MTVNVFLGFRKNDNSCKGECNVYPRNSTQTYVCSTQIFPTGGALVAATLLTERIARRVSDNIDN